MWVGISAVGTFGTDDAGASWTTMNKGVRADFLPETFPEFGQCVHKMLSPKSTPDTLYPESTEGRPWGQPLKKPAGAPLNLG